MTPIIFCPKVWTPRNKTMNDKTIDAFHATFLTGFVLIVVIMFAGL